MSKYKAYAISLGAGICAATFLLFGAFLIQPSENESPSAAHVAYEEPSDPNAPLPILWDAPAFSYLDQNGHRFTNEDLRGHVWICDFFFSTCTNICPMMTFRMSQLQRQITSPDVKFVSFSVDPAHDTPAVLKQYANAWKADDTRWHFLSTEPQELTATAKGMKVFVRPPDKDTPIQHSAFFILVDGNGKVRGVYDSQDESALHQLVYDVSRLAGIPVKGIPQAAWANPAVGVNLHLPGATIYVTYGCVACHAQGHVAPSLSGLYGSEVRLVDGRNVIANDGYLRQTLINPDSVRVAGFPPLMPNYGVQLRADQIGQLIQYIRSLAHDSPDAGPTADINSNVRYAIDPVCGMQVVASDQTIHVDYEHKRYYFCSETCRRLFLLSPDKFGADKNNAKPAPTTQSISSGHSSAM
jgi:protein SCO1